MKVGFFGDLVLEKDLKIQDLIEKNIRDNDFNCLNFEAPFVTKEFIPIKKSINLYHGTENLELLKSNKFNVVNIANNHIFDFGIEAFQYTMDILQQNDIKHFGAGKNIEESSKPYVCEWNGKKMAVFGFAWDFTEAVNTYDQEYGTNPVDLETIRKIVKPYMDMDFKIAYFHFGTEYEYYPEPYQKYMIETLFNEDLLDVVIGNHPHSYQGYQEKYIKGKKKLVFYSLGNFMLPEKFYLNKRVKYNEEYHTCYYVNIDFDKNLSFELVPFKLINDSTEIRLLKDNELSDFNNHMKQISGVLTLGYKDYRRFYAKKRKRKSRPIMSENKTINSIKYKWFKIFYKTRKSIYNRIVALSKFLGIYEKLKEIRIKIKE